MSGLPRPPLSRGRELLGLRRPAEDALARPFGQAWCILTLGGLAGGLIWRFNGAAAAPQQLLAGLSLALALTAAWLAPGLGDTLGRQARHLRLPVLPFVQTLINSMRFTDLALLLALAPCGLLLGYNSRMPVLMLSLLDLEEQAVSFSLFTVACLLLVAPALIVASLAFLHAARSALGLRFGTLAWLLAIAVSHVGLIAPGGALGWPTPLNFCARWAVFQMRSEQTGQLYSVELATRVFGASLALLIAAAILLALAQYLPRVRETRLSGVWLAACAGLAVSALRACSMYAAWTQDSGLQYPGDWRQLMACGLLAAWIVYALVASAMPEHSAPSAGSDLAWLCYLAFGLLALTFAARLSDQAAREEILLTCLVSLVVLVGGTLLLRAAAGMQRRLPWLTPPLLALSLLILIFPPAAGQSALAWTVVVDLSSGLHDAERMQAAALTLGALALVTVLGWSMLYLRRRRGARSRNSADSAGRQHA